MKIDTNDTRKRKNTLPFLGAKGEASSAEEGVLRFWRCFFCIQSTMQKNDDTREKKRGHVNNLDATGRAKTKTFHNK